MITEKDVVEAIKAVVDPEVGFDIYSLGLIYEIEVNDEDVHVTMTLSTKGCPLHELIQQWTRDAVENIKGVDKCHINLVWEPAWNITMASDEVKKALGA